MDQIIVTNRKTGGTTQQHSKKNSQNKRNLHPDPWLLFNLLLFTKQHQQHPQKKKK
jgi:hypothetical protein